MASAETTNQFGSGLVEPRNSILLDRVIVFAAVSASVLLVSLVFLAVVGMFTPIAVALVGLIPALVVGLSVSLRHRVPVLRVPQLRASIAFGVVLVAVTTLNIAYVGEHMLTNRDPGVYLTIARWLSSNGNLLVEGMTGPFEGLASVTANWNGYYEIRSDGLIYSQFLHSYPSLMAGLRWLFGDGALFYTNAAIFFAGMAATYLLIAQFVRGWVATLAVSVTAFTVVAFYFVRSTYSEPLMFFVLVLGLLVFHIGARARSSILMFSSGLTIGVTALVRIDGWMLIGAFLVASAIVMMKWVDSDNPRRGAALVVLVSPFVAGTMGLIDGFLRSGDYLVNRMSLVAPMMAFVAMCAVIAIGLVGVATGALPPVQRFRAWLAEHQRGLREAIAWAVALGALVFLFVRPAFFVARGGSNQQIGEFLARAGQTGGADRTLAELTLRWFTWYWGWAGIALVIAGLLIVLLNRSRIWDGVWSVLLIVGPQMAVYILQPKIVPDQPWAMRRFYATALVLIPLLMAISFEWILRRAEESEGQRRVIARYGFAIAAAIALIFPMVVAAPLVTLGPQAGLRASTNELCAVLPPDAAVVVVQEPIDTQFGAAIRTFCDVPTVASTPDISSGEMSELVRDIGDREFVPVVVSMTDLDIDGWEILGSDVTEFPLAEAVFLRPPAGAHYFEFSWVAATP